MRQSISKHFLLGIVIVAIFVVPVGVFAGVKEGSDENFSWKIEWPTTIKKGNKFNVSISANAPGGSMASIWCNKPSSGPNVTIHSSGGSCSLAQCDQTCSYTISKADVYIGEIRLSRSSPSASVDEEFNLKVCEGDICFENPLSSLTFWQLFNRIMGFAVVVGLAIGPIILLYGFFRFMTSAGDAKKVTDAIQIIKYTLIGLGILLLARGIMAVLVQLLLG